MLSEFDITATGQDMALRYPEGMRSLVDAELALQGPATAPIVTGTVNVKSANWSRGFGSTTALFSGLTGGDAAPPAVEGQVAATSNVRFDVRLIAPATLRIGQPNTRVMAPTASGLSAVTPRKMAMTPKARLMVVRTVEPIPAKPTAAAASLAWGSSAVTVTSILAFESINCLAMSLAVNNTLTVVAVAPARRMPWNATAKPELFGDNRPTTSPTPIPRSASAPAKASMRSIISR